MSTLQWSTEYWWLFARRVEEMAGLVSLLDQFNRVLNANWLSNAKVTEESTGSHKKPLNFTGWGFTNLSYPGATYHICILGFDGSMCSRPNCVSIFPSSGVPWLSVPGSATVLPSQHVYDWNTSIYHRRSPTILSSQHVYEWHTSLTTDLHTIHLIMVSTETQRHGDTETRSG